MSQAQEITYQSPTSNLGTYAWQNSVINRSTNTPPGSPTIGDRYIIGSSPTGAWSGQANKIAQWTGTSWVIFSASTGETAWSTADANWYSFISGSWQAKIGSAALATITQTQHGSVSGLGADVGGLLFINRGAGANNNYCGGELAGTVAAVAYSIDITGYRSSAGQAATGAYSVVVGHDNAATGTNTFAAGRAATASGTDAVAIGYNAKARIADTVNLANPIINRKDNGDVGAGFSNFTSFSGAEVVLMSEAVNFATGGAVVTLNIPSGSVFYPNAVGVICTQQDGSLTGQPSVSFGNTGGGASYYLASSATSNLSTPYTREVFPSLASVQGTAGGTGLTGTVQAGAATSGTIFKGRFYWKGILMEQ